jgi:hypothetical protein
MTGWRRRERFWQTSLSIPALNRFHSIGRSFHASSARPNVSKNLQERVAETIRRRSFFPRHGAVAHKAEAGTRTSPAARRRSTKNAAR